METQSNQINKYNKINNEKFSEIKKLFLIKKHNNIILKKLKHTNDILDTTIDALVLLVTEKKKEIETINTLFLENSKHFKHILSNLMISE